MSTALLNFLLPPARLRRAGLLAGLLPLALAAQAQVGYVSVSPAPNALAASRSANVVLTYGQTINPSSAINVAVFSQQAGGRKARAYSTTGNEVTVNPNVDFKPGETVFVTSPATVRSTGGTAVRPRVFQFTTQASAGPGTFGNGSEVSASDGPVTLGDVDGDGDLDMLVPNYNGGVVSLRLNNSLGGFSGTTNLPVGDGPMGLALADVDGDGDLDLLATSQVASSVRVLLNQGGAQGGAAGTFATTGQDVPAGRFASAQSVAVADVDADGDLDMLVANRGNNTVSVRLNQGGTFTTTGQEVSVGASPQSVTVGDVDGDGDIDLLTANTSGNTVSVRLNNGSGTFASGAEVAVGTGPFNVALGDIDADGDLDMLASNYNANTVSVRLNNGLGAFSGTADLPAGTAPYAVALGDIDGDGDLDALVADFGTVLDPSSHRVGVLLNNSRGTFSAGPSAAVSGSPHGITLGDLDGDGDLDFAAPNQGGIVSVRLNRVLPTITSFAPVGALPGAQVVITGTNLSGATGVSFNGTAATVFSVNSATQVTATVPSGATSGPISVTTPVATATSSASFTVQVRPQVTFGTQPDANLNTAARNATVSLSYDRNIDPATAGNLRVFSAQAGGRKASAYSTDGVSVIANPNVDFKPGETVYVSAPATIIGTDGGPVVPYVFQLTTAVSRNLGTFLGGSEVAVGTGPQGVATADVDGDGDLDMLAANGTTNSVSVRLNQGTGTFASGPQVPVGANPSQVKMADVDGDGDLDLLTANASASTVSVRLNQGGTFATTGQEVAVVATPYSLTLGDVDGDGDLDLVAVNGGSSTVSVRLNQGTGTFATTGQNVLVGSSPRGVMLADLDDDGDLDMLAANYTSNTVSVRLNNGTGTFATTGQEISVGTNPVGLAVTDIDGDGDLDLATANSGTSTVSVRLNAGGRQGGAAGTLAVTGQEVPVGSNPSSLALSDADGDGSPDIFATSLGSSAVSVRLNQGAGSGTFATTGQELSVGTNPRSVALGDLDNDGDLDLLAANSGSNSVSVRFNQAPAPTLVSFTPTQGIVGTSVVLTGTNFTGTQSVRFNGTVAPGFVVNSPTQITVRVPTGATTGPIAVTTFGGTATSATPFLVTVPPVITATTPARNTNVAPRPTDVVLTYNQPLDPATAGNVRVFSQQAGGRKAASSSASGNTITVNPNADFQPGETVLVTAPATVLGSDGTAAVPRVFQFTTQAGAGPATLATGSTLGLAASPYGIATGDVDGDGDLDMLTANFGNSTVSVRLNQGTGTFANTGQDIAVGTRPVAVAVADVDGDGDLDLLAANSGNSTVSVRLNQGGAQGGAAGTLGSGSTLSAGNNPRGLAVGDVDADGDLDVLVANGGSNVVTVYLNSGTGTFANPRGVSVGTAPYGVAVADVDSDGDLDILTANFGTAATQGNPASASTVSVRLNQGTGTFANTGQEIAVGINPQSLALGDVDGDGDLDVLVANSGGSTTTGRVSVRVNNGGTFSGSQEVPVGPSPVNLALGDLDGDGDLDLLTASLGSGTSSTVSVRLNQGGTFATTGPEVPVGVAPRSLALGDLDGDLDLDVLVANSGTNASTSTVSVLLNQLPAPVLSSLTPASGPVGSTFSIAGTNLGGATAVTFTPSGSGAATPAPAGYVVASPTSITGVTVPAGLAPGTYTVTVTTLSGISNGLPFEVQSPPCAAPTAVAVGSLTPTSAQITFTGSSAASSYTATYTPNGGTAQTTTGSASPLALNGLMPYTTYSLTVASTCGSQVVSSAPISFTTPCEAPALTAPANQFVLADAGQNSASVSFAATATGQPAPTITYTFNGQVITSPYRFPIGTNVVTVTANSCGGTVSQDFQVEVSPRLTSPSPTPTTLAVASTAPAPNALAAPRATTVALTYNQDVDPATAAGVRVFSHQAGGRKTASVSTNGRTITLDPSADFKPGETVFVTSPATVRATASTTTTTAPYVYQFTAAAGFGPGTFSGGTTLDVGQLPASVAAADVDNDGDLDLLTANAAQNGTVSVQLNNGQGSFTNIGSLAVGAYPAHLTTADLNGDGNLDLLVANAGSNSVSMRLNNGRGGLAGSQEVPVGTYPVSVAAADIDGDGDLDLLAANLGSDNVSVRFNNGSGSFSGTTSVAVGPNTSSVEAADVDNDGDLDLLMANAGSNGTVSIRLNNGMGSFSGTGSVVVGAYPVHVTAADLDADGDLDLLTANATQSGTVSVRFNQGNGSFAGVGSVAVGQYPASVETADVDGDGDLDLLMANAGSNTVSVRINNGLGSFSGSQEVTVGSAPLRVAAADLDGDGDLDLATADAAGNTVSVRFNQVPTNTAARSALAQATTSAAPSASSPYPLVAGYLLSQFITPPSAVETAAEGAAFSAYPNPFAHATTIRFTAAQAGLVQVRVYNALGQLVTTLYDGPLVAGQVLERPLDATGLSAGMYTCRLSGTGPVRTLKLVVSP